MKLSRTKKSQILKSICSTFEKSSIHALPNILRGELFSIKLLWLICFVISSSGCVYLIFKSLNNYLRFDVVSLIKVKYEKNLRFPLISICNLNTNAAKNLYPNESQIDNIFISCVFNGFSNCIKDFDYVTTRNHECLRFNYKAPFKNVYRKNVGLVMELFVGSRITNENDNFFASSENGFYITITDDGYLNSNSYYEGSSLKVPAGFSTNVILKKYAISEIPRPYSECVGDLTSMDAYPSECYKKTYNPNRKYMFSSCFYMCFQKHLGNKCSCQASYLDIYFEKLPLCHVAENFSLCENNLWPIYSNTTSLIDECDCPYECVKTGFSYMFSMAEYPTKLHATNMLKNQIVNKKLSNLIAKPVNSNLTYDDLKDSIAKVNIYFDELKQTVITHEVKKELSDLVSDIGGLLGLFLGVSFLSLVEFVEILMHTAFIILN